MLISVGIWSGIKYGLGGGIFLVEDTCQSKALFHRKSETLRVLV